MTSTMVLVSRDENHMATTFELKIACGSGHAPRAGRALEECHALLEKIESELTEFRAESPVAQLNIAEPLRRVPLPTSAWDLLDLSLSIEKLSQGAFSPAAKSAGAGPKSTPSRFGFEGSGSARRAWRVDQDAHLGFGAIGKGYALDCCRSLLSLQGFNDFILSGGGSSILLSGHSPEGRPWTWGWSWAKGPLGEPLGLGLAHPSGTAIAIGVSGLHEKGLHLIDPRAQAPLASGAQGLRSALVAHPSAAWADALSTALFVAGWEESLRMLSGSIQAPAMAVIDANGVPRWNGTFQALWGPALSAQA